MRKERNSCRSLLVLRRTLLLRGCFARDGCGVAGGRHVSNKTSSGAPVYQAIFTTCFLLDDTVLREGRGCEFGVGMSREGEEVEGQDIPQGS